MTNRSAARARTGGLFATAAGPMVRIRPTLLVTDALACVAEAVGVREVREHAVAARHDDERPVSAAAWLRLRLEIHEELVDAIISGDVPRPKVAIEKHAGLLIT
ncbi:MAG: hypothetical protein M3Y77_18980 [Actinomycetota bacterium]|nr:hypothetical protein [Actinomycetota bacterium]